MKSVARPYIVERDHSFAHFGPDTGLGKQRHCVCGKANEFAVGKSVCNNVSWPGLPDKPVGHFFR
ncbi:hypothetical protein [Brucella gallinifaecis]|uniref:hypothetical protein n=1 Tax=Brucella gallinifaecis TaxID=215590 RepID=UPI00235DC57F|nr:hypothetical protein [Brucella gallinifaecis]